VSVALVLVGCADDIGASITEATGTTQGTTSGAQTTSGEPTTATPTTGDPTTPGTSTTTGDTSTSTGVTTGTETGTSTTDEPDTGTSTTGTTGTTGEQSSSSGTDTDTGGGCVPGEVNCECVNEQCVGEAACLLGICVPFTGQCEFEVDFECDEGTLCAPGTDPFDCCPSQQDGNCEEFGMGGACPVYSDYYDCNYCIFVNDLACDEPDLCPSGTDDSDCCATEQNGQCEEMSMGGMCQDGSDYFDCGYCPYENDGFCDAPGLCPADSDAADCCATPEDGICEEMQFGGECDPGTDYYDCGYCLDVNDGFCDEPFFCPEGTDESDCCVTENDGICDEAALGGACASGQDFYDCGYCPYEDDDECDVPQICPDNTDVNDCS
jgi:hypothetical protein